VRGETFDLVACAGTQPSSGHVEGTCRHAEPGSLPDAQPTGKADPDGRKHRVASAAMIELLESRARELDHGRGGAILDQDRRIHAARDQDPAGARSPQRSSARNEIR
jgi:hypothetical protein